MQKPKYPLTAQEAGHFLSYNEADGTFTRRNSNYAGLVIRGVRRGPKGRKVEVRNIAYSAHNIAYLLKTGDWPASPVYHIDGDLGNNRWSNLTLDKSKTPTQTLRQSRLRFEREQRRLKAATVDEIAGEIWRPIANAPGYFASDLGRFKGRLGLMDGTLNHTGYQHIGFTVNGKQKKWLAHRIVAEAFLKRGTFKIVNHKDGNRANNRLDNLEWCNHSHNTKHGQAMRSDVRGKRFKAIINHCVWRNTL